MHDKSDQTLWIDWDGWRSILLTHVHVLRASFPCLCHAHVGLGFAESYMESQPCGGLPRKITSFDVSSIGSMDWFKGKSTGNHGFYHQI